MSRIFMYEILSRSTLKHFTWQLLIILLHEAQEFPVILEEMYYMDFQNQTLLPTL